MFISPDLMTRCVVTVLETLIFAYYLKTAFRFLWVKARKEDSSLNDKASKGSEYEIAERDPYTIAMLVLICIGVGYRPLVRLPHDIYFMATEDPPYDPDFPAYKMDSYLTSWEQVLNGYLSSATLRLAVVVNVTRWFLLYLSLRL